MAENIVLFRLDETFYLFAASEALNICLSYEMFDIAAVSADIAVNIDSGENGRTVHDIASCAVTACIAFSVKNVIAAAFRASSGIFHNNTSFLKQLQYSIIL